MLKLESACKKLGFVHAKSVVCIEDMDTNLIYIFLVRRIRVMPVCRRRFHSFLSTVHIAYCKVSNWKNIGYISVRFLRWILNPLYYSRYFYRIILIN